MKRPPTNPGNDYPTSRFKSIHEWMTNKCAKHIRMEIQANGDILHWYALYGKVIIVQEYSDDMGWDAYVPVDSSNSVQATLLALEKVVKGV